MALEILSFQKRIFTRAQINKLNTVQANIIVGQATTESGHFSSHVFAQDSNCFGMKMPHVRPRTYIDGPSKIVMKTEGATPYAHYNSLERCIDDLILGWHAFDHTNWALIQTPAQYAAYLVSKGYYPAAEEQAYANDIASVMKHFTANT